MYEFLEGQQILSDISVKTQWKFITCCLIPLLTNRKSHEQIAHRASHTRTKEQSCSLTADGSFKIENHAEGWLLVMLIAPMCLRASAVHSRGVHQANDAAGRLWRSEARGAHQSEPLVGGASAVGVDAVHTQSLGAREVVEFLLHVRSEVHRHEPPLCQSTHPR